LGNGGGAIFDRQPELPYRRWLHQWCRSLTAFTMGSPRAPVFTACAGVLRVDANSQKLADSEVGAVDCARFPEREAMMKRLQQTHN
jgi:hypothetical protein